MRGLSLSHLPLRDKMFLQVAAGGVLQRASQDAEKMWT